MTVEDRLKADFGALVRRLEIDGFSDGVIAKMRGVDRMRLLSIGAAAILGAVAAASQFPAMTKFLTDAATASGVLSTSNVEYAAFLSPALMSAIIFAMVAAATAMIAPDSR